MENKERERALIELKRSLKDRKEMFRTVDVLLLGSSASSVREATSSLSDSLFKEEEKEVMS